MLINISYRTYPGDQCTTVRSAHVFFLIAQRQTGRCVGTLIYLNLFSLFLSNIYLVKSFILKSTGTFKWVLVYSFVIRNNLYSRMNIEGSLNYLKTVLGFL